MLLKNGYISKRSLLWFRHIFVTIVVIALLAFVAYWYVYKLPYTPPGVLPFDIYVEIPEGASAGQAAKLLEQEGIVRNAEILLVSLQAQNLAGKIKSGNYYFDEPATVEEIITRITQGQYDLPTQRVTLYEGEANFKYANRLAQSFEYVNESRFLALSRPYEGYLFPDTYFFPKRSTAQEIINIMRENFKSQIQPFEQEIEASPYTLDEIVTMASLVESEAGSASFQTKQRVAGILLRRLEIGMPLQADAVFSYIYQQHLPRVLYRHLEVESPYNIYKNTGLPPGPIGNPGIDSIKAVLNPIDDGYLYYLTGNNGKFYYAQTLARHERNRDLYLQY